MQRRALLVAIGLLAGCSDSGGGATADLPSTASASAGTTGDLTTTGGVTTSGDPTGSPTGDLTEGPGTTGDPDPTGTTGDPDPTGGGDDYPPELLCPPAGDPRCGPPFDPNDPLPADQLDAALTEGLATWRFPGKRGACAGCHSADGYELAKVGFADDAILRRAKDHVSDDQAQALVLYVHALRQKHAMTELLHPAKFRPLQPTHLAFAETTPNLVVTDPQAQDERDLAFMNHLVNDRKLLWATGKIDSLAAAKQAWDELHAIDLTKLKLGIPFDHLSEDGFYGDDHLSVFEWFPGMASTPAPADEAAFYAVADAYLADPSDANLWQFYDALLADTDCVDPLDAMGDPEYYRRACDWMRLKWRSMQVFAHMLRHGSGDYPDVLVDQQGPPQQHTALFAERIPIWEAGDFLRVQPLQRPPETACFVEPNHPCTLLPPPVDDTIHSMPTYEEARIKQSEVFQQSWFVMSFQRDPALVLSGENFATFIGDYIESVLLAHYDVHHAFLVAKMSVEKSALTGFMDAADYRQGTGKLASVRTFSFKQLRNNFSPPPDNDPRRATHERMFANFARMSLFLVEDDLKASGTIYDRDEVLYACRFMRTWILELEGAEDPAINAVMLSIESLAAAADDLRTDAHRDAYPGTGLQPTGTWGEFADPYNG